MLANGTEVTLRYFTAPHSNHLRIEWAGKTTAGLVLRHSSGCAIQWAYDAPPDSVTELALECAMAWGQWDVPGCEHAGVETEAEQSLVVSEWGTAPCPRCSARVVVGDDRVKVECHLCAAVLVTRVDVDGVTLEWARGAA